MLKCFVVFVRPLILITAFIPANEMTNKLAYQLFLIDF